MRDEEVVLKLRASAQRPPHEIAQVLEDLLKAPIGQGSLVTFFKRAFPSIPLGVLLRAGEWRRVSAGGLTDEQFDALLQPYLR